MTRTAPFARNALFIMLSLTLAAAACQTGQEQVRDDDATTSANEEGKASQDTWEKTLDSVVNGVVALRVTVPRDFDTDRSGSYQGTGFIVDAERGIILTNRHLVQPGPVQAEAVFLNHEEVPLQAIYRDPVHDFGFFKFDPEQVEFSELVEIPLAPEGARRGIDIRVIGNDAGEKLSILQGTLARLDRPAPKYDSVGFNDFNTFYYQAASGTSGGSSGSPVIDVEGRAVALNAGGAFLAESSFFLPLDRVVRALERYQKGDPITRGTLQTILLYKPYEELRRLGLPLDVERAHREKYPDETGMMVVDQVVPEGPGDAAGLEPGDIVYALNGDPITGFVQYEEVLDSSVGESVELEVFRGGDESTVQATVGDLHEITPSEYIEVGDAIVHRLSYQQARNFRRPVEGLYIARGGYMLGSAGMGWGGLLQTIDGEPVRTLEEFWEEIGERKNRERMQFRYVLPFDPDQEHVAVVYLDRRWFPIQWCKRDDATGEWPCEKADPVSGTWTPEPREVEIPAEGPSPGKELVRSLVMVEYDMPHYVEGIFATHYVGAGLIVDAEKGLVVTDRDTVPVLLGDLQITFGGSIRVPGEVVYVHPTHNFSVVKYDPSLIGDTPVETAELEAKSLEAGEKIWLVGLDKSYNLVSSETKVERISPLQLGYPDYPAFRDSNIDVVDVGASTKTLGGVLASKDGKVHALYMSFGVDATGPVFRGIPVPLVNRVLEPLRNGEDPGFRTLGVELRPVNPADAVDYGLPQDRLAALLESNATRRQILAVERTYAGFPSAELLSGGDLLLSVNGTPVTTFDAVEKAAQAESVKLEVLRNREVVEVEVPTVELDGQGVTHVASWGGMLLHDEHLAIAAQRSVALDGVYIAWTFSGSPASHFGISASQRITEVNGTQVKTLDDFLDIVAEIEDGEPVRLLTVDFDNREQIVTMETDTTFWPAWDLRYENGEWTRSDLGE